MSEFRDIVGIRTAIDADAYDDRAAYVDTNRYSQVYHATHKGELRLPFMNRSFISFSFGGKNIEDFNLIATIDNNRLNRSGSAEFEDLVDQYNIVDGQFYWGTHFKPNKISFKLATDGMSQKQLDEFKHWFAGGKTRELILAEHPNRAILARINTPPDITMLPFEEKIDVLVSGQTYYTSTTKYKGEIQLDFVMDNPYWYSKINIFGYVKNGVYYDKWTDANGQEISVFDEYSNMDVIKIVYEDHIPIASMITVNTLLGNNIFANIGDDESYRGKIAHNTVYVLLVKGETNDDAQAQCAFLDPVEPGELTIYILDDQLFDIENTDQRPYKSAVLEAINTKAGSEIATNDDTMVQLANKINSILGSDASYEYNKKDTQLNTWICDNDNPNSGWAHIHGPFMDENTGIPSIAANTAKNSLPHVYYSGTAPTYPILKFTLTPAFLDGYICSPANSYKSDTGEPYNTITLEGVTRHEFKFTTPNLYTSFNEAIRIFKSLASESGKLWEDIRVLIRDNVKHYAVRAWANRIIDAQNNTVVDGTKVSSYVSDMQLLLFSATDGVFPVQFVFDGKNGKSTAKFKFRVAGSSLNSYSIQEIEEDVSDMLKSDYLIITDRNVFDNNGNISGWVENDSTTHAYNHIIYHDVSNGLQNIFLEYKNMYY